MLHFAHARFRTQIPNTFYANANLLLFYMPIWRIKCFINNRSGSTNHNCCLIGSGQDCVLNLTSDGQNYSVCEKKSFAAFTVM